MTEDENAPGTFLRRMAHDSNAGPTYRRVEEYLLGAFDPAADYAVQMVEVLRAVARGDADARARVDDMLEVIDDARINQQAEASRG